MLKYPYLCLTLSSTPKCYFFAGRHFFIRKMKIKMADRKKHVLSKVVKNIIFQNKTVMFYRHNKTFWYQFCNFKHFLKPENSEDSLASSCEEFSISFRVTQYETGLLLELRHTFVDYPGKVLTLVSHPRLSLHCAIGIERYCY